MASNAELVITRNHPQDIQDRPVYVCIDGEKSDGVRQHVHSRYRAGPPQANNTLFSHQVEFEAKPGETIRYRCENGLTGGGMIMVLMMGVADLGSGSSVSMSHDRRPGGCYISYDLLG